MMSLTSGFRYRDVSGFDKARKLNRLDDVKYEGLEVVPSITSQNGSLVDESADFNCPGI